MAASSHGSQKFNADEATKGKPCLADIGRVLSNFEGQVFLSFSKFTELRNSNEAAKIA